VKPSFPDYRLRCGWNALLPRREPAPALSTDIDSDVAIIGAGYTGIAIARRWQTHYPGQSVALIDSSEIGEGNPGRNSGFLLETALAEDADAANLDRMRRSNAMIAATLQDMLQDIADSGASVDIARTGTYRAAASDIGARSIARYEAFLKAAELPYEKLTRSDLQQRIGSSYFQEGLYSPHCYLAQPAQLIRALFAALPDTVSCFENTPALSIENRGSRWLVTTPKGSIQCDKLFLANNAFAKSLGIGQSQLVAMYTYAGLTPALPESLHSQLGSDSNWGLLPTHRLGSTLRRTVDQRLLIRSSHDYEHEASSSHVRNSLTRRMHARFPQLKGISLESVWGGAVGFTYNGGLVWGEEKPGLFVSAGCNGGGTVKGTLLGRLLADLAVGADVPDVTDLFGKASWMPPEPIRALGFHITSQLEQWAGRAEM